MNTHFNKNSIQDYVRWGIIGCGNVCDRKSGPALSLVGDSFIIGVMRRNTELARDFAQRHRIPKWYTDADALIHDPEVDAIYIATPPDTHARYAIKSLTAGKPVLLEKPMALNYQECKEINAAASETGVALYIAYYRRAFPYYVKIKEELEKGTVGVVTAATLTHVIHQNREESKWRLNREIFAGGFFFDMACHQLDLLDFLIGPVTDACGYCTNRAGLYSAPDTVNALLRFESGALASCCWCYASEPDNSLDRMEIFGTRGKVTFSMSTCSPVVIQMGEKQHTLSFTKPLFSHIYLIEKIVNTLLGKANFPSNRESAARVNWVMDRIIGNE